MMGKVGFKKIFLMTNVYEFGPLTWDIWDDLLHHRPWLILGDCFFQSAARIAGVWPRPNWSLTHLSPEHHGLALPSPNQISHPMLFSDLDLLQESQSVTVVKCGTMSSMLACDKMENLKDMSDRDTIYLFIYLSICLSIYLIWSDLIWSDLI